MKTHLLLLVVVSLFLSGCGTLTTQLTMDDSGRCPGPRGRMIDSGVYRGVVYDSQGMAPQRGERARLFDILFLVDLPISAVADTLILPFTLGGDNDEESPAERATEGSPKKYHGFSVAKLDDGRWSEVPGQPPNMATFRIPPLSRTHTVFATASCKRARPKVDDIKELKETFDAKSRDVSDRHELISLVSNIATHKGRECVAYSMKILDKAPRNSPTPLVMTFDGFLLIHPDSDRLAVDVYFSERGTKDEVGKGTEALRKNFLESVEIRSIK